MKQVTLLPQDFNTLDTELRQFAIQYTTPYDCPIVRALKRNTNGIEISMGASHVTINGKSIFLPEEINFNAVVQLAKRVEKNGKARLRFGVDILEHITCIECHNTFDEDELRPYKYDGELNVCENCNDKLDDGFKL